MLTCLSNNKKMFLVPVLLLKYIFSFFNSVFLLLLFCFFFFKTCIVASNCPGDDRKLTEVQIVVEGHLISVAAREK